MNSFGRLLAGRLALVGGAVLVGLRALTGEREARPVRQRTRSVPCAACDSRRGGACGARGLGAGRGA